MPPLHVDFLPTLPSAMRFRHRAVPPELMPGVKAQLDEYETQGYLRKPTRISHYGVPLVVVKKSATELRLCGDYCPINVHVRNMPVQIPACMSGICTGVFLTCTLMGQ